MLILPTLQHDEWFEGYRGRLARLNDLAFRHHVEPALQTLLISASGIPPQGIIPIISMALGVPITEIVLRHTLWPAQVAVDRTSDPHLIEQKAAHPDEKLVFSSPMRKRTWLCPECVTDDLARRPYAHWRRSHQMPGQVFCRDHGTVLAHVPRSNHMLRFPDELVEWAERPSEDFLESVRRSPQVSTAVEILNAILDGRLHLEREACAAVLGKRAKSLGMAEGHRGRFPEVSDLIGELIPVDWLRDALPKVTSGITSSAFVDQTFDVTTHDPAGASVAAVAAVLYADGVEALQALGSAGRSNPRSPAKRSIGRRTGATEPISRMRTIQPLR